VASLEARVAQQIAELRRVQDECKQISRRKDLHDADRASLLNKISELGFEKASLLNEQLKLKFEAEEIKSRSVNELVHATVQADLELAKATILFLERTIRTKDE
jgi:hypothetical protein